MDTKSILEKTKKRLVRHQSDIVLVSGVVLISLLSFAAGYILAKQDVKEPIQIEQEGADSCGIHVQ